MKHALVVFSLLGAAAAQGMHPALPGMPMTPPPVDHPALAAQPLFQRNEGGTNTPAPAPAAMPAGCPAPAPAPDPAVVGPKRKGPELKKAVAKVADLEWFGKLATARDRAAAEGKPILWLQSLGDLEGFA